MNQDVPGANFEQEGVVSLWVFREAEDPANSGKDVLKALCGVESYEIDSQEGAIADEMQPLSSLLGQLSYSSSFINDALNAATRMGIKEAYGVLAQFDFAYDRSKLSKEVAKDPAFIGFFDWHGE